MIWAWLLVGIVGVAMQVGSVLVDGNRWVFWTGLALAIGAFVVLFNESRRGPQ